jgi:hypothetical protein
MKLKDAKLRPGIYALLSQTWHTLITCLILDFGINSKGET